MLTGGVAKYISQLMDAGATTKDKMLQWVTGIGSPYLSEGTELIMSEFGKEYSNYLSILQMIAGGMTVQNQIDSSIGKNTGTYLKTLDEDYNYIHKLRPMFSKPESRNVRWYINDCFLRFWFRFILSNQALVEMGRNDILLELVEKDYNEYTGHILEQYFRQKYSEEEQVTSVGHYWDSKGENEIDLIALNSINKTAIVAEIKRNPNKFSASILNDKYEKIRKEFGKYKDIRLIGLSMEDM